jgi:RimJ/RimL family protein N-acetyltransferase
VWKPDGKTPLGGIRFRWKDEIKDDLKYVGWWLVED